MDPSSTPSIEASSCPPPVQPSDEALDMCLEIDPCNLIQPKLALTNMVSGVFLKNLFFLNTECSKFAITGLFHDRSFGLGMGVFSKKSSIFLNYDTISQLVPLVSTVNTALEAGGGKHVFQLESGEGIVARKLFGKWYVHLSDTKNSVTFSGLEWIRFVSCLPILLITMQKLSLDEENLRTFITNALSQSDPVEVPVELNQGDQLSLELMHFKSCPVW